MMPGASGALRSRVMLFLFRAYTFQCTLTPASRQSRRVSPRPGASTFTTSAPRSASCRLSMLPATRREKSRTRMSWSGPLAVGSKACFGSGMARLSYRNLVSCPAMTTFARRSSLILPVNQPRFVERAYTRGADAIVLDLEDSVPAAEKENARRLVKEAIPLAARGGAEVSVRVNNEPGLLEADVDAAVHPGLDNLGIPKAE